MPAPPDGSESDNASDDNGNDSSWSFDFGEGFSGGGGDDLNAPSLERSATMSVLDNAQSYGPLARRRAIDAPGEGETGPIGSDDISGSWTSIGMAMGAGLDRGRDLGSVRLPPESLAIVPEVGVGNGNGKTGEEDAEEDSTFAKERRRRERRNRRKAKAQRRAARRERKKRTRTLWKRAQHLALASTESGVARSSWNVVFETSSSQKSRRLFGAQHSPMANVLRESVERSQGVKLGG